MSTGFITEDNVLNVQFKGQEFPLVESENGVVSPDPNLYSLGTEDGVLVITERVAPKPKSPLGKLWVGICTIYEYRDVIDPDTYQTKHEMFPLVINEPCRISFTRESTTDKTNGAAKIIQNTMLFIRPDLEIKPGCIIEVTQHGRTVKYKGSSKTALYTNHQEVEIELYEDDA